MLTTVNATVAISTMRSGRPLKVTVNGIAAANEAASARVAQILNTRPRPAPAAASSTLSVNS